MAVRAAFDTPIISNDQSFDRVLNAGLPVAALFWSGTQLDPALDRELIARARADSGQLIIVKVRSDENPALAQRYAVRATPMLVTFRSGKELTRAERPTTNVLTEHLNYLLGRGPQPRAPAPSRPVAAGQGKPVVVTDQTFATEVMQSPIPVVVDFWAPWCGPCRMVAPALEKLAAEYESRLRIAKLNVDENPSTPQQFQVQGIPTMLFVKNGRVVQRVVGALPEPRIREQVEKLLQA